MNDEAGERKRCEIARNVPSSWLQVSAREHGEEIVSSTSSNPCRQSHWKIEVKSIDDRDLVEETKQWMFDVTERNMRVVYEKTWGWNSLEKRRELSDQNCRFVFVYSSYEGSDGDERLLPKAFAHFRFEVDDDGCASVYVYELQVENDTKRAGLGTMVMECVERIGRKLKLKHCALTVLKANEALKFYRKIGYEETAHAPRDAHYIIMKKVLL